MAHTGPLSHMVQGNHPVPLTCQTQECRPILPGQSRCKRNLGFGPHKASDESVSHLFQGGSDLQSLCPPWPLTSILSVTLSISQETREKLEASPKICQGKRSKREFTIARHGDAWCSPEAMGHLSRRNTSVHFIPKETDAPERDPQVLWLIGEANEPTLHSQVEA